ncbi:hypothetical protein KIW84_061685, partial [Lathyrus oleraceus]
MHRKKHKLKTYNKLLQPSIILLQLLQRTYKKPSSQHVTKKTFLKLSIFTATMSSSSSTLFIALQCFQCSTMQVKQKKKSSHKWNCTVCNEKQLVRKVFAHGYKVKDVRTFVQTFNMSRKSLEDDQQWLLAGTLTP